MVTSKSGKLCDDRKFLKKMEMLSPLTDKGSSPACSITKMHSIITNHQAFINEILKALLTCNPQNSQFTNQITKIQEDFNKSLEENDLIDNNTKTINTSFQNFVETTDANVSCIKIDIDQLNKQTNENCEVLTTLGANLQSLRDDFELFKMKRSAPASPRKRNDQSEIEKIKSDVESLKNALEVVNDNYVPNEKFENAVNDIKNLNEIAKKMENANYQKQIQELSKSLQDLTQKENSRDQQINKIENAQNTQEGKIQQSITQISKIENTQNAQEGKIQQLINQISKIENAQNAQEGKIQQSINQISKIENAQNTQEGKIQQLNDQISKIENAQNSQEGKIQQSINQISKIENAQNSQEGKIQQLNNQISKIENSQNSQEGKIQQLNNQISKIENAQNAQEGKIQQSINQIGKIENAQSVQEGKLQQSIDQVSKIEKIQNSQEDRLQQSSKQISEIKSQLEEIKNSMNQTRDAPLPIDNSEIQTINQRLDQISGSQTITDRNVNSIGSHLEEQQSKYLYPLMDRVNKIESQLKEMKENQDAQNNIVSRDQILNVTELPDFDSINQRLNELTSSQNKTIETVNALNSKFEEQLSKPSNELKDLQERIDDIENITPQSNGLDKNEILQIPEISDIISIKELVNEIISSQTKTVKTVNALNSKLEEHNTNYTYPLLERVEKIEDQLNEFNNLQERMNEIENNNQNNGLDKDEILQIPEISDVLLMKDLVNEIASSQTKTIGTVNALNSKLEEQQTKYSRPLLDRVNKIEEQLNQIENNQEAINSDALALLEDKISNLEKEIANPEIADINLIKDRLNELTASQNRTIETINALNSKLLEQQTKYSHPLLERVGKLEEQLNQIDTNQEEIQNIQAREIKIDDDDNFNELKENVDLISSKQQEMMRDIKSQKSRLNNIDDDYSSLQGQINEISSKLASIENDKGKKKFTLPSFSSDDNDDGEEDENNGTTDSKLRKRVSKLEKIVAHLMSGEQLKSKMIPIDFVDEVDMENETTDETLRRHNKEISILAKDFIVLSNEVIDIQGTLNEQKIKEREPKETKQSNNEIQNDDDLIEKNNRNGNQLNNEDLDTIKTRVEEIASFYSKLHEANKQLIPHIRQHQSDINLLSEKQKSLEDQFEQFEMLRETENYQKPTEKDENEEEEVKVTTRQIVVNDSEELSALKLRVNELTSAFATIRDLNKAIIDRMRNVDSDISLLMAKQNQIEEQNSMSEHDHEHSGRHVKRVKKHHRRSRRHQFEEEEEEQSQSINDNENGNENEPSQSNNENGNNGDEPQIKDRNINQNTENQNMDEIIERVNVISSNNAKLFDVCKAIKSHLESQQKEISGFQKISHDIRCIKHELRMILTSKKERNGSDEEEENKNENQNENENESSNINSNYSSNDNKISATNEEDDEDNEETKSAKTSEEQDDNSKLDEIESAIKSITDKLSEVINASNDQTQQIENQKDHVNKQLLAIKSFTIQLKDKDEQIEDLQKELIKQRNEIIDLKEDQNSIKNVQERSVNLDQPKLPHDLIDTIDNINRRLDELEQNKNIQSRIDEHEQMIKELASKTKIITDSNNGQKAYMKKQNQTINQISSEIFERIEEIEFNLSKLDEIDYTVKCIKYEVKRLKNAKVASNTPIENNENREIQYRTVQNNDEIEGKLQEHEELLTAITERMPQIIENTNKLSDIIEKHKLMINQQTAAIKSLIENRTKYNLNENEEEGTSSYGNNLRQEINQIKRALNNLSNNQITQRSIPSQLNENDDYLQKIEKVEDDIQNLERKVQQQEETINKLCSIPESTGNPINDRFLDLIKNHINKVESAQKIIIQDQNAQRSNINYNKDKLSLLEVKFDQIEERLDLIERNKGDNEIIPTNENGIVQEEVYNKIAEQSDVINSLKQQIESIQDSLKSTQNDQEISEIKESIQSLKKSIKIIESKLKNNFIKITDAHQTIVNRFDKVSKDIRLLKENNKTLYKQQQQHQDQEIDINIESNKPLNRQQEISVNVSEIDQNNADFDKLVSEFSEFKKNQEQLNSQLKKLIDESNQNTNSQIQNAVNLVKNELNQKYTKNQNQNQNPNSQTDLFSLKKEIDTLKINDIRKEINSLKNEQKKILSSLSKTVTNQSPSNDERISVEAITTNVNKMKDELTEISSHIQKNDEYLKKELENKSAELNSNAEQIEEAKKLANRIVKIVRGHDEKLKKIKDHIDYQNVVLSEITGRDIKMVSSRPTTPK